MGRLIVGLIKGLVVGGAAAYGALRLGLVTGFWTLVCCAVIGAFVGIIAGKAPWKAETLWTPAIKALFGAIVGVGLGAAVLYVLPDRSLFSIEGLGALSLHSPVVLPVIGALFGAFVELDDGGDSKKDDDKQPKKLPARRA